MATTLVLTKISSYHMAGGTRFAKGAPEVVEDDVAQVLLRTGFFDVVPQPKGVRITRRPAVSEPEDEQNDGAADKSDHGVEV